MLTPVVSGLFADATINSKSLFYPDQPRRILEVKADGILEDLGFAEPPEFGFGGFGVEPAKYGTMIEDRLNRQQVLALQGQPYRYWHRWSPRSARILRVSLSRVHQARRPAEGHAGRGFGRRR